MAKEAAGNGKIKAYDPWQDMRQVFIPKRSRTEQNTLEVGVNDKTFFIPKDQFSEPNLKTLLSAFDSADSINKVCDKMEFRHPHVFGPMAGKATSAKEIADTWELVKAKEKGGNKRVMDGIPKTMPALLKALSLQEKARGCGFDWKKKEDVWDKVQEEVGEVADACRKGVPDDIEGEFGDLLFSVINASRMYGVDPETALNRTAEKFRARFNYIEENVRQAARKLTDLTLEEMDAIWDEAKAKGI